MNLTSIMSFNRDWNEEVIAKFYSTLYVLDDGELHFMDDNAYGDIKFRTIHGLMPYYKLLNQLFCYTLCPKSGDSDNISNMSKNLLARMAPNKNEFSVFDFIWEEIIICTISPKKGCHYAPYIFAMIKEVTSINILTDKGHQVYKPKKGQLECLLKLGAHAPHSSTQGPSHGPSSSHGPSGSHGPSSSQGPSSSRGPPPRAPKKKGFQNFLSQGLFACFNVGRHNAQEIHDHKKHVDEQLLKIEARQKEIMAQV
jgi:hypothetical protein